MTYEVLDDSEGWSFFNYRCAVDSEATRCPLIIQYYGHGSCIRMKFERFTPFAKCAVSHVVSKLQPDLAQLVVVPLRCWVTQIQGQFEFGGPIFLIRNISYLVSSCCVTLQNGEMDKKVFGP